MSWEICHDELGGFLFYGNDELGEVPTEIKIEGEVDSEVSVGFCGGEERDAVEAIKGYKLVGEAMP